MNHRWINCNCQITMSFSSGTEREGEGRLEETIGRGEESSVSRQFSPDVQRDGSADRRMERRHRNGHVVSELRHMAVLIF